MSGKKEAPLSDRLRQGRKTKEDEFLCPDDYITNTEFFAGFARWHAAKPKLEMRAGR